jgi:protein-S-isoprenylcysteine O-methyltransferase Ste14
VRHPIYAGIIFFAFGFALFWSSGFKLIISTALLLWFWLKSVYEEKKLDSRYSNYKQYKQKTGRFFPKL